MTSCPLLSSPFPKYGWQMRKEEEEEAGMILLVLATVRQTDLGDLWVLQMCKPALRLVRNSEDSLEQYSFIYLI